MKYGIMLVLSLLLTASCSDRNQEAGRGSDSMGSGTSNSSGTSGGSTGTTTTNP